jgi:hypothetical protein
MEWLGIAALGLSVLLVFLGVWSWAQETMTIRDAGLLKDLAVVQEKIVNVERRISGVEDRLFGIFLTTLGALVGSVTSGIFSIRTLRRLRNEGG